MLTDGKALPEEVNRVLKDVEIVQKPFNSKALKASCCYCFICIGYLGLIPILFYGIPSNFALISIPIIGVLIFTVLTLFIKKLEKKAKETAREACLAVVERANQEFSPRGLRWHLPDYFPRWIELWKDYIGQPQINTEPQYQTNYYPGYENNAVHLPPYQV